MISSSAENAANRRNIDLRAALIDRCRLATTAVEQIDKSMLGSGKAFVECALELGLITQEDVESCIAWAGGAADAAKGGLVEEALRKLSDSRQVTVRHGDVVKPGPQLTCAYDPHGARSEAFRSLRTELLLRNETGRPNVVCVVSASPAEGRSQLAAELAIAFAQLGRRTLLVDADLRKPSQHALFPCANDRGLGESLVRGDRAYQYRVDGLPSMGLITSGISHPNPLELLSGGGFSKCLTEWRANNEFIVVDTPPINLFADALAVATLTGRALVVARANHTLFTDMNQLVRRLATTRALVLGAVINHF